ncbi:MAG: M23 family metallopeptidase [Acutalibacteraceae bacterium]
MIATRANDDFYAALPTAQELPFEPEPEEDSARNFAAEESAQEALTPKSIDRTFRYMISQIVVCAAALLAVLALKMIGGYYYDYARAVFDDCYNQPINKSQVLGEKQARAVVAAQSTVYGMGGESDDNGVARIENKSELSSVQTAAIGTINKMICPVDSKTVTCEYGYRIHPVTGKRSFHTGIDIGEDMRKNIFSVLDGKVKRAVHDDPDYGNYLVITHSGGVDTMYAHCDSLKVKAGDRVKKGQVIALVGTTGLSTGPHLHFEVRINDTRLNPRWFINIGDQ